MMISRGLFGWSPPHMQPLTPVSEVSELPESPSPYPDPNGTGGTATAAQAEDDEEMEEPDEVEPPSAAVPFSQLFACADRFDWVLMIVGSVAAVAHGSALIVYLHYFAKIVEVLAFPNDSVHQRSDYQFDRLEVGNCIHNMATFISRLVIGFFNYWEIALITLATGPFIVAAGGISDIFLHRLAENIQDAYAEAAASLNRF